jgi:hypothetical protein
MEKSEKKSNVSARIILSTAAILAVQAMPATTYAQTPVQGKMVQQAAKSSSYIYIKIRDTTSKNTIVGFENGSPVFKNAKGEFFTVNGKTGDLNYIKPEEFAKFYCCMKIRNTGKMAASGDGMSTGKRLSHIKIETEITDLNLVGVDNDGNTIQKNSRGETFYLDPVTGDMIFVKI